MSNTNGLVFVRDAYDVHYKTCDTHRSSRICSSFFKTSVHGMYYIQTFPERNIPVRKQQLKTLHASKRRAYAEYVHKLCTSYVTYTMYLYCARDTYSPSKTSYASRVFRKVILHKVYNHNRTQTYNITAYGLLYLSVYDLCLLSGDLIKP
jgi:dGTP triphosphohydrolase